MASWVQILKTWPSNEQAELPSEKRQTQREQADSSGSGNGFWRDSAKMEKRERKPMDVGNGVVISGCRGTDEGGRGDK